MHVAHNGQDTLALHQDTEMMSAQDMWLRKHHELWEKLEDNTKSSICTALWKWLVPTQGYAICILAWELQRGVPPPYGKQFSKETLMRSASSKAFAAILKLEWKIEDQDKSWWDYRLLYKDLWHANKKQDRNALANWLQPSLDHPTRSGGPVVKSKVLHVFRVSMWSCPIGYSLLTLLQALFSKANF
ncbi:hypothetical protein WJX77_010424 [Trebouxia sp. C0004]